MSSQKEEENGIERENLVLDRVVSSGPEFSSELTTVETHDDLETSSPGRTALIATIIVLCLACLIVGVVLLVTALTRCKTDMEKKPVSVKEVKPCGPSVEAKRTKLFEFFKKVQNKYFELHPNSIVMDQSAKLAKIKEVHQAYDFKPSSIKKRTDSSLALLDELNNLNVDTSKLKARENKLVSQMKFYLKHTFGQPYDGDYYTGAWMMGPNFFCMQPICMLGGYDLGRHLPLFAPKTVSDIKRLEILLQRYNSSIYQYIENVKLGVKSGMVRSVEECKAGLNTLKGVYKHIELKKESGVFDQWFGTIVSKPEFYKNLLNTTKEEWRKKTGKAVNESVRELIVKNVGVPIRDLLSYLANEHMRHCVPSNVSSGLANRPLSHVYVDGKPTKQATQSLPTGEKMDGKRTYANIMSFFTTTDVTPDQVYEMGWKRVKEVHKQMVAIAKQVTNLTDTKSAIKQFRADLKSQSMYFNDAPLPKNEFGTQAYKNCSSVQGAKKYCPARWKALQKWFKTSQQIMSVLDSKTIDMFYFVGRKHTTPNCPVKLVPDFNPSSPGQSYRENGPMCSKPCEYYIPFFLDNMGPVYSERSVNAHEARPGHHTQSQGYEEHFRDSCGGVSAWLNHMTAFLAFSEGWGLYAENLIAKDTDFYEGRPLSKYGWLKWQMWRSLRLVIDTGLHFKGMTRQNALNLFDQYAWDDSDIPGKEVTRYQSGPGQATTYMIGEMTITRLRREAEAKLGNKFNLKDFHYQVLSQGSAPLSFLIGHINRYVTCKWNVAADPVCQNILSPPSSQPSRDLVYRTFGDVTIDVSRASWKRYV